MSKLKDWYASYCNWVFSNPTTVAEFENMFTWGSMALCAKSGSLIWPEFLYSTSNLVMLHNDITILKKPFAEGTVLKICLSVVEYCEVLFEVTAISRGRSLRLPVVYLIQIIKCLGRLYLIKKHNELLISNPPFQPLNREEIDEFRLRDKPRKLRTYLQDGGRATASAKVNSTDQQKFLKTLYSAEIIYTMKPLAHLLAMYYYGEKSWVPWMISLCFDVTSNTMNCEVVTVVPTKRNILMQRYIRLLLYFLRSPLYENIFLTSTMIELKNQLFQIPIFGIVLQLLLNCIPKYRHYYFYLWSH
ncbi:peroxisomal membrane protein PEX16 [Halyomorpha halys]|uniref:peroxisomal membrane protein PEX16 n=1 Tax=Halyomorpha halys TaxID=286706 RepID=UPI0006D50BF8|nr:peroxisomal membrane protein PEX16 [Halyomorpha halys]